jgi:DNA-binding LytR/AlgR family response regulator
MQNAFFLKTNGDYTRINYSDIIYIECVKNYVRIITTKTAFIALVTMKHVEKILPQDEFCRIHRSYIVSLNHIHRFSNKYVNIGERRLPISDQNKDILMEKFVILTPASRNKNEFCNKLILLFFLLFDFSINL